MSTYNVIDVSSHQGKISDSNWDIYAENCHWVILRGGYRGYGSAGTLVTDPQLGNNMAACKARDLPFGVYWVSQAVTTQEAVEEVAYLEKAVGDLSAVAGGVWLDSEWSNAGHSGRADGLTKAQRTAVSVAWLEAAEAKGAYAGIYASKSWFSEQLEDARLTPWAHWVAQYASKCTYAGTIIGWQFSESNGLKLGTSTSLDCSYFYFDVPGYIAGKNQTTEEEPEMTKAEIEALIDTKVAAKLAALTDITGTGDTPGSWAKEATEWAKEHPGADRGDFKGKPVIRKLLAKEKPIRQDGLFWNRETV